LAAGCVEVTDLGVERVQFVLLGRNTMRGLLMLVAAAVLISGFAYGEEPQQPNENLKGFRPFIGAWRYKGPALEDSPWAKKGGKCLIQLSWRWILDKQVVMNDWEIEVEGGVKLAGRSLIGWNAADKKIISGGMDSTGGMGMGTVMLDRKAKTMTITAEGVDPEGEKTAAQNVVTMTDRDTLTVKALERIRRNAL
jgi:hypothetical protein